ncbi:MAG: patatin family protein [Solobacterium sp.]|nr:patatin family protein [Solobacterium sp.]
MKKGLVLEGGAMRGLFTAGVIDVFLKEGIMFDGVIGVSAGAAFGFNYKSRQIGRVIRYNTKFSKNPGFCSFRSWLKTGDLYNAKFCYDEVPAWRDPIDAETYLSTPDRFYAVATDTQTGEAVIRDLSGLTDEEMEFMRASASMPAASRPVEIEGRSYLDGGISDPIPLKAFQEMGYDRCVTVLTQPRDYVKQPQKMMGVMELMLKDMPAITEGMKKRHLIYNEETAYVRSEEEAGRTLVIAPQEKLPSGRIEHSIQKMLDTYDAGVAEARRNLDAVRAFLAEE